MDTADGPDETEFLGSTRLLIDGDRLPKIFAHYLWGYDVQGLLCASLAFHYCTYSYNGTMKALQVQKHGHPSVQKV